MKEKDSSKKDSSILTFISLMALLLIQK